MGRSGRSLCSLLLLAALGASTVAGQYSLPTSGVKALRYSGEPVLAPAPQVSAAHTHKLAGFGAGVTASAIVMSLDDVVGSSCIGSGAYLSICRLGFVAAAAIGGGVGTLVGMLVKTDQPPGRTTRILVGSSLGATGTFLASLVACQQEDRSNPESLCGHDGMVSAGAVVVGAAIGGALGAVLGGGSENLQVSHFGLVPRDGRRVGLGATFTLRPHW
jgi:hypothetical protein